MQRTRFLGISMAERSHRRALVVTVYILLTALIVGVAIAHGRSPLVTGHFLGDFNFVYTVVFLGISWLVFGSLVKQATVPMADATRSEWKYISISKPVPYTGAGDPDERELAVRNRAYFVSFRLMAAYLLLLWLAYLILNKYAGSISVSLSASLVFPLVVMALTLPQAVVLWTEPDVPATDGDLADAPPVRP
jgi:hypothetical protein